MVQDKTLGVIGIFVPLGMTVLHPIIIIEEKRVEKSTRVVLIYLSYHLNRSDQDEPIPSLKCICMVLAIGFYGKTDYLKCGMTSSVIRRMEFITSSLGI